MAHSIELSLIASKYLRAYKALKQAQYCLDPKPVLSKHVLSSTEGVEGFIWGSIKKQNLAQQGFSLLVGKAGHYRYIVDIPTHPGAFHTLARLFAKALHRTTGNRVAFQSPTQSQ